MLEWRKQEKKGKTMTVKELIEELQKHNQNANITLVTDSGYWPPLDSVQKDDATDDVLLISE